jgi:hypothetical protein
MTEALSLKALSTVIASSWARGSTLLWGLATACIALIGVLRLCMYFELEKASGWWSDYGLLLILASVCFLILASFKSYSEREKQHLSLIANEGQSFWHHATQPDGSVITQLALRFQATNMGDAAIHLSSVRLNRPWVRRASIIQKDLHTRHPTENMHSSRFPIRPHSLTEASAHFMLRGAVGSAGRRRAIRVVIGVQDHAGRCAVPFAEPKNPRRL